MISLIDPHCVQLGGAYGGNGYGGDWGVADWADLSFDRHSMALQHSAAVKSRLAVSFAIAQSSVLAVFESRIQAINEEYRYIPETLAAKGKVQLTAQQLGHMIGKMFVIRHDVNLHSEILDTPDYFWSTRDAEPVYRMTEEYLEMRSRTEVLNMRLNLMKELFTLLQQQQETAHSVKLEWIVIWLIVMCVVLEWMSIFSDSN